MGKTNVEHPENLEVFLGCGLEIADNFSVQKSGKALLDGISPKNVLLF